MLQFCQQLQTNPKNILPIIQNNLNNPLLLPLITQKEFLLTLDLQLTHLDQTQFFIEHVFKTVREPKPEELLLLRQFSRTTENQHMKDLALIMIDSHEKDVLQILSSFLKKIRQQIFNPQQKQLKRLLTGKVQAHFEQCMKLLAFLCEKEESKCWGSSDYVQKLTVLTNKAFSSLDLVITERTEFLTILAHLLLKTIKEDQHTTHLMFLVIKLAENHPEHVKVLVKQIQKIEEEKEGIPNCFLSKAVFYVFKQLFKNQVYFDIKRESCLDMAISTSQMLFSLMISELSITQLGWVSLFAVDRVALTEEFEKELHICSSLLRELWFHEEDLIIECFSFIAASYVQKTFISDNFETLQSVLTILTPRQLKYLMLKLNSILSQDKKRQIVEQCLKQKKRTMRVIAFNFSQKMFPSAFNEFQEQMGEHYNELMVDIEESRYNSYEKEVNHFVSYYNFIINNEFSEFRLTERPRLLSKLHYYKNMIKEDYLSQQYWINKQKMVIFTDSEISPESIEILCQFIQMEKICNLSVAMTITAILSNQSQVVFSAVVKQVLDRMAVTCMNILAKDGFASNITISLQFFEALSKANIRLQVFHELIPLFYGNIIESILKKEYYSKIHYLIESISIKLLEKQKKIDKLEEYSLILPFFSSIRSKKTSSLQSNFYTNKTYSHYAELDLLKEVRTFDLREMQANTEMIKNICQNWGLESLQKNIKNIDISFQFWSPTFREEIVSLTYIAHSPQDNYYFRNHFNIFLLLEQAKILSNLIKSFYCEPLLDRMYRIGIDMLQQVKNGDTLSHGKSFYQSFIKSQIGYILFTKEFLTCKSIGPDKLSLIIEICLEIIQKQNYPLIRQHVQAILCRSYFTLNSKVPENTMRQRLLNMLKVNINSGIPIALTLGYELLQSLKQPSKSPIYEQIQSIHEVLVKFISCHTAYLRAICQFYLHTYLQLQPQSDQFLTNISSFWLQDKDSQKILKNVSIVVQGFKEAVESNQDFVGFERVEEYASNRVKLEMYRRLSVIYAENILNEIAIDKHMPTEYYIAYCEAVDQRYQYVSSRYLELLDKIEKNAKEGPTKSNMKSRTEELVVKNEKTVKKTAGKKTKGKNKKKMEEEAQNQIVEEDPCDPITELHQKVQYYSKIEPQSRWLRKNLSPQVIVIATLLEKVHNFGHILRTLHGHNALLVVPSETPLHHPECKELVPLNSDVPIVEIRQKDLHKFIILMKSLGYPMVALEQCSRSVQVESAVFPDKFMLLLGNERLGAPGWLLNEGDLLVQIPQVGKIRSLNVHVSMVLCIWQYLIQKK